MWIYVNWIEFRMLYNTVELLDIADLCHTPSSLRPRWCRLLLLRRHEGAKMISAVTPMAHSAHSAHSDPIAISCHHGLVTVLSRQVGTATTRISRLLRLRVQLCRTSLWSYLVKIWWVVEYCCCCCCFCCCCCCRHWGATFMLQVHSYIHMAQTITDNASSDVSCAGQTTPLILVFGDWCDWCDCEVSGVQTEQVLHHRHVIDSHGQEVCALNRFRFQDRTLRLVSWVAETKCVLVANLAGESYAGVLWFAILDMIQTFAGRRFSHCNMAAFLHTNTCWLTRAGLYSNTHQRNPGTCTWDQNASWHLCGILWKCIFLSDFWCDLPLFHLQILPRTGASSETEGEQKVNRRCSRESKRKLLKSWLNVWDVWLILGWLCRTCVVLFWVFFDLKKATEESVLVIPALTGLLSMSPWTCALPGNCRVIESWSQWPWKATTWVEALVCTQTWLRPGCRLWLPLEQLLHEAVNVNVNLFSHFTPFMFDQLDQLDQLDQVDLWSVLGLSWPGSPHSLRKDSGVVRTACGWAACREQQHLVWMPKGS